MVVLQPFMNWWAIAGVFVVLTTLQIIRAIWLVKTRHTALMSRQISLPLICTLLVFVMVINPSLPGRRLPAGMLNLDVVMVVDTTPSMSALDYSGNQQRRDGVRSDLVRLQKELNGARISIITVDETVHTELPFTTDTTTANSVATTLDTYSSLYSTGSSLTKAVDATVTMLKKSKTEHPTRSRLVFYFGDGEQNPQQKLGSFAAIQPLIQGGGVLGYGTTKGGKMRLFSQDTGAPSDEFTQHEYITQMNASTNYQEVPVVSKINEANLKQIADELHVPYSHRTSPSESLNTFIPSVQRIADTTREVTSYDNLYWIAALALCGVMIWMLIPVSEHIRSLYRAKERL